MAAATMSIKASMAALLLAAACASPATAEPVRSIYWSDGDSGRANGVPFRLADVDAPETGGVGSRGGAKCEMERELGFAAKEFIVNATKGKDLTIAFNGEIDDFGRKVATVRADDIDVASSGFPPVTSGPMSLKASARQCPNRSGAHERLREITGLRQRKRSEARQEGQPLDRHHRCGACRRLRAAGGHAVNDATRIAGELMDDTFACPAAILVALVDDPGLVVLQNDRRHLETLTRRRCLAGSRVMPLGRRVATALRPLHGLQPWPSAVTH